VAPEDIGAEDTGAAAAEDAALEEFDVEAELEPAAGVLVDPQAARARANPPAAVRPARRLMIIGNLLLLLRMRWTSVVHGRNSGHKCALERITGN